MEVEVQEHAHLTITDKSPAGLTVTPESSVVAAAVPVVGHQEGQVHMFTNSYLIKIYSVINPIAA